MLLRSIRVTRRIAALALLCAVSASAQAPARPATWIDAGEYGRFHIVLPREASDELRYAATLFQSYWQRCTGQLAEISAENGAEINVWIGREAAQRNLGRLDPLDTLGPGGFVVRTFVPLQRDRELGAQKQLILAGVDDAATVDAVFEFFQHTLGVRWLAPGVVLAPRARFTFPAVDLAMRPAFAARAVVHAPLTADPESMEEYRRAHRLGGPGGDAFAPLHPRLLPGELLREVGANPDSDPAEGLREALRTWASAEAGAPRIAMRIEGDAHSAEGWLRAAIDAVSALAWGVGGKPALVLALGDSVGETIAPRELPAGLAIELDATQIDWRRPLRDRECELNRAFADRLRAWRRVDAPVYVRMPLVAPGHPLTPLPVWLHLRDNIQLLAQYEVAGVELVVGDPATPYFQDLAALRAYLAARHLADPDLFTQHDLPHFLQGYYGPAAPRVQGYLDLLRESDANGAWIPAQMGAWWNATAARAIEYWTSNEATAWPEPFAGRFAAEQIPAFARGEVCGGNGARLAATIAATTLAEHTDAIVSLARESCPSP